MSELLDWVIVGGGIHGVHLSARLVGEAGYSPDRIRIVDPGERLLERWRTCTAVTGMTHLRSPCVHNIDVGAHTLRQFAEPRRERVPFVRPYDRPSLALFNAHCDHVIEMFDLAAQHVCDWVASCEPEADGVCVTTTTHGQIYARRVILAIGASEQPYWPIWAVPGPVTHHVFAREFDAWPSGAQRVAVIGGGISAAQVALRLVDEGHDVHIVCRHEARHHQFDSDPGWLGPRFMNGFAREPDVTERRRIIRAARHRGSMPPDVGRAVQRACERSQLAWHAASVELSCQQNDGSRLILDDGGRLDVDQVLLATGFVAERPGGAMVDELIESASLRCAPCGFPMVDDALRWHPHIFVSGPLAELELGPTARNIAGARRAGDRIMHCIARQRLRNAA